MSSKSASIKKVAKERPLTKADKALIKRFFKLLEKKPSLVKGEKFIAVENDGVCDKCGTLCASDDNYWDNHALWTQGDGKYHCRDCCVAEDEEE